jgi:hypothetical protein
MSPQDGSPVERRGPRVGLLTRIRVAPPPRVGFGSPAAPLLCKHCVGGLAEAAPGLARSCRSSKPRRDHFHTVDALSSPLEPDCSALGLHKSSTVPRRGPREATCPL